MGSDLHLEQQMEDYEEAMRQQKALEAATLIAQGTDRASAVKVIKDIYDAREDAKPNEMIFDEEGFPDFLLDEMQTPEVPQAGKSRAQVEAIAKEIVDWFD